MSFRSIALEVDTTVFKSIFFCRQAQLEIYFAKEVKIVVESVVVEEPNQSTVNITI